MTNLGFAIIANDDKEPSAVFQDLDDAIAWGLRRHGGAQFRIRHVSLLQVENDEQVRSASARS